MALRWPGSGAATCRCGARWVARIRVDRGGVGGGAPSDWEVALQREGRRLCGTKCGGDAGQREEAGGSQGRRREVSGDPTEVMREVGGVGNGPIGLFFFCVFGVRERLIGPI